MCPSLGHGNLPLIDLCRCGLIAKVREDERGESGDYCKGWDAGWLAGQLAALLNAVEAVKTMRDGTTRSSVARSVLNQSVALIEALGGEQ
jgi:hypothetical protein